MRSYLTEKILLKESNGHRSVGHSYIFIFSCIFLPNASLIFSSASFSAIFLNPLNSFFPHCLGLISYSSTCPVSKPHRPRVTMTFSLWPLFGASYQSPHQKGADLDHWDVTCSISQTLFCAHPLLHWHHNTHDWMSPDCSDPTSPDPLQTLQRSLLWIFNTLLIITL